jgi:hypothetical protein
MLCRNLINERATEYRTQWPLLSGQTVKVPGCARALYNILCLRTQPHTKYRRYPDSVRDCFDGGLLAWLATCRSRYQRLGTPVQSADSLREPADINRVSRATFKAASEGRCFLSARLRSDSLYQPPSGSDLAGSGGQKISSEAFADGMAPTGIRGVLTLAGQGLVYLKHSPTGITGV